MTGDPRTRHRVPDRYRVNWDTSFLRICRWEQRPYHARGNSTEPSFGRAVLDGDSGEVSWRGLSDEAVRSGRAPGSGRYTDGRGGPESPGCPRRPSEARDGDDAGSPRSVARRAAEREPGEFTSTPPPYSGFTTARYGPRIDGLRRFRVGERPSQRTGSRARVAARSRSYGGTGVIEATGHSVGTGRDPGVPRLRSRPPRAALRRARGREWQP